MKKATIYFYDSILVVNYRDSIPILSSGNILKLDYWSGGKIGDYNYEYDYKFTEEDYKEALKLQ